MEQRGSGGFDARTLLAFALMILVWVAFTQFLIPKKPQQPPDGIETTATTPSGAETGASPDADQPRRLPPSSANGENANAGGTLEASGPAHVLQNRLPAAESDVVIESKLYHAVFSSRGANIRSWVLKNFTDAAGAPVDLVPKDGEGALSLRWEGPEGEVDLGGTVFQVEQTETDASGNRVVRFIAEGPLVAQGAASPAQTGLAADPASGLGDGTNVAQPEPSVRVERTYILGADGYDIRMELLVDGVSNERQNHRVILGWPSGIPNLETHASLNKQGKAAIALLGTELVKDGYGGSGFGCGCGGGKASHAGVRSYEGQLQWAGVRGKYFSGILIPDELEAATFVAASEPALDQVGMMVVRPMAFDGPTVHDYRLYLGPIDYRVLADLDKQVGRHLTRLVDYGGKLIAPISRATHWFLLTVHRVVPNYGIVILLLAIVVRILFHPLTVKSLQSQRKMQAIKPEVDEINAKYKDNPEQRSKKTMELYKRYGINPLGGCLPLLVQMPVIYALYNVLMNAMELRKAPFALWVRDLSSPDTVGRVMGIPINVLPLLMAATMFWQQKLTPTDPRQAPMLVLMPVMMVFFFYGLPSGLVFYWTVTNLLAIAQQLAMKPPQLAPAIAAVPTEKARTTKRARA